MNTKEILTGIQDASCKAELSAHVDLIGLAIERDQCEYNGSEWQRIAQAMYEKSAEFNERVFH